MEMFGVSKYLSVPVAAAAVWLLVVGGSYKRVQKVFLVLSCVFVTYIVAAFMAEPNWNEALASTVVPHIVDDQSFVSLVIAMIGTTIAPWMMFFAQSNVVEKGTTVKDLFSSKVDAVSGTIAACLVAWFIIVTTGAVLYPQGIEIESAADAARALAPFAGQYAEALFAIGLIAASFLAACVLPLTTSFVICEAFGWEAGVSFKWKEAPLFKSIFTFVIVFSAVVVLVPNIDLLSVMLTAQFVNGIILPVLLVFMAIISADKRVMGAYRSRFVSRALIWLTVRHRHRADRGAFGHAGDGHRVAPREGVAWCGKDRQGCAQQCRGVVGSGQRHAGRRVVERRKRSGYFAWEASLWLSSSRRSAR